MNTAQQIIDYAYSLFDMVGVSQLSNGNSLLILGLESTPQRNLDDFGYINGNLQLYGFRNYIQPKLRSLLSFIRNKCFSAESIGRYGYPLKGEVNLKEHAIAAGLGKRGKSTVVLHAKYGTRLRFIAVSTDAPLEPRTELTSDEQENPVCDECSICIDVCPTKALKPYYMPDAFLCLSNISPVTEEGKSILCDICLQMCPANKN